MRKPLNCDTPIVLIIHQPLSNICSSVQAQASPAQHSVIHVGVQRHDMHGLSPAGVRLETLSGAAQCRGLYSKRCSDGVLRS